MRVASKRAALFTCGSIGVTRTLQQIKPNWTLSLKHWFLLLIVGLVAILGGIFAVFNPIEATFAAMRIVAWIFIIIGVLQIVAAFGDRGLEARIWTALLGPPAIVVGYWIITIPIEGTLELTWTNGSLFLMEGIVKIVLAFAARGTGYFWMQLLSGAVSVLLAGNILSRVQTWALRIPGILLAVDLISTGVFKAALALHFKSRRTA